MDQFVVDVGDDAVRAGDEVLLFGPGTPGSRPPTTGREATGTIAYEIVTRIGGRVPAGLPRRTERERRELGRRWPRSPATCTACPELAATRQHVVFGQRAADRAVRRGAARRGAGR